MIDPEFWSDEKISNLSLRSRLLFIGIWNYSDDEGVIKARSEFLKSSVFPYDEVSSEEITECVNELCRQNLIFKYEIQSQSYAIILNFKKHQVINKPVPSKLPKPSIQNTKYKDALYKRDNYICHLCGEDLSNYISLVMQQGDGKLPSLDHIIPQSKGGNDMPYNLKTACLTCNKRRGNKSLPDNYGSDTEPLNDEVKLSKEKLREVKLSKENTYGEFKNVFLSKEEFEKLTNALGEKNTNILIAELSSYMASKGKRYSSHYATIQNWARRRVVQHAEKLQSKGKTIA